MTLTIEKWTYNLGGLWLKITGGTLSWGNESNCGIESSFTLYSYNKPENNNSKVNLDFYHFI